MPPKYIAYILTYKTCYCLNILKSSEHMMLEYKVKRKLQEQSGSYFVILPKIWVESLGLKQGDKMTVVFNGNVRIEPPNKGGE